MKKRGGFTLIELLCVLAIMAIMIAVAAPSLSSMLSAMGISTSTNQVFAALTLARQDAITRNRPVAIYFFQYPTPAMTTAAFRGFQVWELGLSNSATPTLIATTPVDRFTPLGGRTVLVEGLGQADVLNPSYNTTGVPASNTSGYPPFPPTPAAMGTTSLAGNCMAILFRPNGSTSLPLGTTDAGANSNYWSLTCADYAAYNKSPGTLPADSATIQIDALSGTCQILRP